MCAAQGHRRRVPPAATASGLPLGLPANATIVFLPPSSCARAAHRLTLPPFAAPPRQIFTLTGFCPQFGGLWPHLTVHCHLIFYLRLRGFEGAALEHEAARVERAYGLTPHALKRTRDCSGGTRRKLNAAIALSCGQPQVHT